MFSTSHISVSLECGSRFNNGQHIHQILTFSLVHGYKAAVCSKCYAAFKHRPTIFVLFLFYFSLISHLIVLMKKSLKKIKKSFALWKKKFRTSAVTTTNFHNIFYLYFLWFVVLALV